MASDKSVSSAQVLVFVEQQHQQERQANMNMYTLGGGSAPSRERESEEQRMQLHENNASSTARVKIEKQENHSANADGSAKDQVDGDGSAENIGYDSSGESGENTCSAENTGSIKRCSAKAEDQAIPSWVFLFLGFSGIMPFLILMATTPFLSAYILQGKYLFVEGVAWWRNIGTLIGCSLAVLCAHNRLKVMPNLYVSTIGQALCYLIQACIFGYLGANGQNTHPAVLHTLIRVGTAIACLCGVCSSMMNAMSLSLASALQDAKLAGSFSIGFGIAGLVSFVVTLIPMSGTRPILAQVLTQIYFVMCVVILVATFVIARMYFMTNETVRDLLVHQKKIIDENNGAIEDIEAGKSSSYAYGSTPEMVQKRDDGSYKRDGTTKIDGGNSTSSGSKNHKFIVLVLPILAALYINYLAQYMVYPNILIRMKIGQCDSFLTQEYFTRICMALVPFLDVVGRFTSIVVKAEPPKADEPTKDETESSPIAQNNSDQEEVAQNSIQEDVVPAVPQSFPHESQPSQRRSQVDETQPLLTAEKRSNVAFRSRSTVVEESNIEEASPAARFMHLYFNRYIVFVGSVCRAAIFLPFFLLMPGQKEIVTDGFRSFLEKADWLKFVLIILFFILGGWFVTLSFQQGARAAGDPKQRAIIGASMNLGAIAGMVTGSAIQLLGSGNFVKAVLVMEK